MKRLIEPYLDNNIILSKSIFVSLLWSINGIIHIIFLERFTYFLEKGNENMFISLLKYYIGFIVIYEILTFSLRKWGWVESIPKSWDYLSKKYLKKYVKLDNNIVDTQGTGKLISIIYGGIRQWGFSLWNVLETGLKVIITISFSFYMVSKVSNMYGMIFLVLFIIFSAISVYFDSKLLKYRKKRNENFNVISKDITKVLMNKTEILQTNKIKTETEALSKLFTIDSNINKDMGTNRSLLKRSSEFGISIFFIFSYYFLGKMYFNQEVSLNVIVGFGSALLLMQRTINDTLSFYIQFMKDFTIIEKLWDFFDSTPEIKGYEIGKTFIHYKGNIEIKNLTYGYTKGKKIFNKFNLEIKGEKITALVGLSGSGKTTLVKLIAGYIRTDSGKIIIDGQDLNKVSLKSYYRDIGYLTQEPSVFDGTILDNLTYAINGNIDKEKLNKIIKLAKCEFIYDLPKGIKTEIGERGVRLSGGQRQRLAIAKIFLKNPKIIILDEPTSALDSFSEEMITKAMHNLFKGRTVIIIAHRLQTVKHANDIILLKDGQIIERGTHHKLIKQKGIYNKMLELQSGF